jgi:hypothetical protein
MNTETQPHRSPDEVANELRKALIAEQLKTQAAARAAGIAMEKREAEQKQREFEADLERKCALRVSEIVESIERTFGGELYLDAEGHVCSKISVTNDARWVIAKRKSDVVAFLQQRASAWIIA